MPGSFNNSSADAEFKSTQGRFGLDSVVDRLSLRLAAGGAEFVLVTLSPRLQAVRWVEAMSETEIISSRMRTALTKSISRR